MRRQAEVPRAAAAADTIVAKVADASSRTGDASDPTRTTGSAAAAGVASSARHAAAAASEQGESSVSQLWDTLSPDQRREHDRRALESALAQLESPTADTSPAVARQAETALGSLRVSLFATPRGRTEYAAYERRVEAATQTGERSKQVSR